MDRRIIALAALLLAACKKPTTTESAGTAAASTPTEEADRLFAERADEEKLKAAIAAYEAILATSPKDRHALERATRGWYFWGDGFTTDKVVQIERWAKALEYGNRCLDLNEKYSLVVANGGKERTPRCTSSPRTCPAPTGPRPRSGSGARRTASRRR